MSSGALEGLDLERQLKALRRTTDADGVAVCASDGRVVASWSRRPQQALGDVLSAVAADVREAHGASRGLSTVDLGAAGVLIQTPLLRSDGEAEGWLCALYGRDQRPDSNSESDPDPAPRAAAHASAHTHTNGPDDAEPAVSAEDRRELELVEAARTLTTELRLRSEVEALVGDLSARHEELNLVYEFGTRGGVLAEGPAAARVLLANFAEYLDVDAVSLTFNSFSGASITGEPIFAEREPGSIEEFDLIGTQLAGDVMRFVATSRRPLVLNEPDHPLRAHVFANLPYRVLACPVLDGSTPIAVLSLVRRPEERDFSNSDRNLVTMIASQTAVILRDRWKLEQMQRFSGDMAAALIEAIEAKDPYTRGHSERVQTVAVDLARVADLYASDVDDVSWGALLHDVGKIGVPDSVLCKRGLLSDDEYTLIKIHPERSYQILRHVAGLSQNVLSAARYHQEKYDGTGYPHGLRGTQIPVHARLIAIADTYDALTSSRSYRAGQTHAFAMKRIVEVAGSQLDPHLVGVFEKRCDESPAWISKGGAAAPDDDD